ncbi:MAG: phosphoribosylanthranilate isomerase [Lachnospiraceae bacterium]
MQIKICGLFRQEDAEYVNEALPDFVGFIFWEKSRRFVSEETATRIKKRLDTGIRTVGVFVDEDTEKILQLLKKGIIDIAQLHGQETEEEVSWLKEQSGKPVWKAVVVKSAQDVNRWRSSAADCLVFDGGLGEGNVFCWEYLQEIDRPFLLAGGINEERLKELPAMPYLAGIDISSGVETNGLKDREKILRVVRSVRAL